MKLIKDSFLHKSRFKLLLSICIMLMAFVNADERDRIPSFREYVGKFNKKYDGDEYIMR
jgi:hypothetical protein